MQQSASTESGPLAFLSQTFEGETSSPLGPMGMHATFGNRDQFFDLPSQTFNPDSHHTLSIQDTNSIGGILLTDLGNNLAQGRFAEPFLQ